MSLENVKAFYEKLANDEAFRTQLQAVASKEECSQIVKNAGYNFTTDEFEEYTAQLLDLTSDKDEIQDLDEKELEAVFGGALSISVIKDPPMMLHYGLPYPWPPIDIQPIDPQPIDPQPIYETPKDDSLDEISVNDDLAEY